MKRTSLMLGVVSVAMLCGCITRQMGNQRDKWATVLQAEKPYVSLTTLTPTESYVGWSRLGINWNEEHTLIPFDKVCSEFIFAHAPSFVKYNLPPDAKRFFAVGYSTGSKSVSFKVLADGKIIYQSKELTEYPECAVVIDAAIPDGSKTLLLRVETSNGNSAWSHWCWPRLYK